MAKEIAWLLLFFGWKKLLVTRYLSLSVIILILDYELLQIFCAQLVTSDGIGINRFVKRSIVLSKT